MDTELLGYIQTGVNTWEPFYAQETARTADLDKIVFGSTTEECQRALEVKYPPEDPTLCRVSLIHRYGNILDTIEIIPSELCCYTGYSVDEAIAIGRRIGSIRVSGELLHDNVDKFTGAGFYVPLKFHSWYKYSLKYDPKGVTRLLKMRGTRQRNGPVRCTDLYKFGRKLGKLIDKTPITAPLVDFGKLNEMCNSLLRLVVVFNYIYGDNAHRKLPEFREVKILWKSRKTQTERLFREDKSIVNHNWGYYLTTRRQFCNWMDAEIRVRDGALCNEKSWKPLRKCPSMDKFLDVNYKKKEEPMAKKKAAPKKATKKAAKKAVKKVAKKAATKSAKLAASRVRSPKPIAPHIAEASVDVCVHDNVAIAAGQIDDTQCIQSCNDSGADTANAAQDLVESTNDCCCST